MHLAQPGQKTGRFIIRGIPKLSVPRDRRIYQRLSLLASRANEITGFPLPRRHAGGGRHPWASRAGATPAVGCPCIAARAGITVAGDRRRCRKPKTLSFDGRPVPWMPACAGMTTGAGLRCILQGRAGRHDRGPGLMTNCPDFRPGYAPGCCSSGCAGAASAGMTTGPVSHVVASPVADIVEVARTWTADAAPQRDWHAGSVKVPTSCNSLS